LARLYPNSKDRQIGLNGIAMSEPILELRPKLVVSGIVDL
jgi:hypothetical protein